MFLKSSTKKFTLLIKFFFAIFWAWVVKVKRLHPKPACFFEDQVAFKTLLEKYVNRARGESLNYCRHGFFRNTSFSLFKINLVQISQNSPWYNAGTNQMYLFCFFTYFTFGWWKRVIKNVQKKTTTLIFIFSIFFVFIFKNFGDRQQGTKYIIHKMTKYSDSRT